MRDLENVPLPVARQQTARGSAGGIMIRTTPGVPDSVDIMFFDGRGADLSQASQRKLDRVFARQEYRRAFPGEIGDLSFPASVYDSYTGSLLRNVDTNWTWLTGSNLLTDAWSARLTPYYFLATVAVGVHVACGLRYVMLGHGAPERVADRVCHGLIAVAVIVSAIIMTGLIRASL